MVNDGLFNSVDGMQMLRAWKTLDVLYALNGLKSTMTTSLK